MNKQYKENFILAGQKAKEVRAFGKSLIVKGSSYNQVIMQIRQKIVELDALPAFPPQIALDHVAAHYLVEPDSDLIFSTEVVKLDVGVCYKGAIGDCAVTVDLSGKYAHLIEAAESALLNVEKSLKVGMRIGEIGKIIEDTILFFGLQPIRNLSGHGLGLYKVHTSPMIPNYNNHDPQTIKPGMTFAVEPFATTGKGSIYDAGYPTIFSYLGPKPVRSEIGHALLPKIRSFNYLPFAIHDLIDETWSHQKVRQGLIDLMKAQVIAGYAPLIEEKKGMVAQAENSFLIDENGNVLVTTK